MQEDVVSAAEQAGFEITDMEPVDEIDGSAYLMEHRTSGAKLLFLENDDVDKAFSITFKTPAADDTGVFHILEHSVLCGSEKFPVKEPFVNLLKGSMQTFLNAMTFPDKTMYPVASTNMTDLMHLTDVYMDAVFHPNIYRNQNIFKQEGWHIEALPKDARGAVPEGELDEVRAEQAAISAPTNPKDVCLSYNGVVYNEMKGALSEPDSVLYDTLSAALFPDVTYRFESGGTPASIPCLAYEDFLDAHRRHYRADNAYIILYGAMDIVRMLRFLDEEYLSKMPRTGDEAPINPLELQKPVINQHARCEMATSADNACVALGYVVGTSHEALRVLAVDILMDAIAGSNESPLKRAVIDAKLGDDFHASLMDSVLQPFVMMELKGAKPDVADRFEEVVLSEIERLAEGGLDPQLLHAAIDHAEFVLREHNFGMSDGVVYAMSAMNGWLYDDRDALAYIRYEDLLVHLKEKVDTDWFRVLLREVFLESHHHGRAQLMPVSNEGEIQDERLVAMSQELTRDELLAIEADMVQLVEGQMAPDSPEALATLPKLAISDLGDAPTEAPFSLERCKDMPVLRHEVETHGIAYVTRYYDLDRVAFEELPYVAVLAMVLGRLDTAKHTAAELDTLAQGKLGNFTFAADVYKPDDEDRAKALFLASASALAENVDFAAAITDEVLASTDFRDTAKILDMLVQRKVALEQSFAMSGHSTAANRALSYVTHTAKAKEQIAGIDAYLFIRDLVENFDTQGEALTRKLEELAQRIFTDDNCILSFAGPEEGLSVYLGAGCQLGVARSPEPARLRIPEPEDLHEAFGVPADVTFTALAADRSEAGVPFSGEWLLATKMITLSYLWNEVRVVGGAYGVGFSSRRGGNTLFHSYRDPKVSPTIEAFLGAAEWLRTADIQPDEFEGYVVSTVASLDAPQKPRNLVRRQDTMHFTGCSFEDRAKTREEVIGATLEDVQRLADPLRQLSDGRHLCCVGNADIIKQSGQDFTFIELA